MVSRLWVRCEQAVALPCLTPAPLGWNPGLGSVLWVWERLCRDFLRDFQMVELKGALCHPLLSSAAGWGSAQAVWLPWAAAGACGLKLLAGECGEPQG